MPHPPAPCPLPPSRHRRYVRIFQICLMSFVVATCYLNVGKQTLDDGNILMGAMFYS